MKPIVCEECNNKIFKNLPNFRKHVRHFHPTRIAELFPKKAFNFSCEVCGKNFSHKRHLLFHNRKVHNGEPCKQLTFVCPLCEKNILWDEFTNHVEVMHDVSLVEENLCFSSLREFSDWKDIIEAEDLNHYIKVRGDRQTGAGVLQRYFHCHRSGHYQSKGERLRRLKSQGSKKINAYCPASMKVTISPDGSCNVSFLKTHLGHQNDLRHLTLTRSDKKLLSSASAATDIKFCDIFEEEEVAISTSDEKVEKLHLITQKDLSNIEAAFDYWSTSHKDNEITTINTWVELTEDAFKILYYKPPDRVNTEFFELEREDYLIFMNEAQCEILRRFGQDCICIDQTHEVNINGFQLITLFVVDSMRQGFPCAFLICKRTDQAALTTFLSFIKEQVGILIPKVFMANIDDFLYDLWVCVMGSPDKRLFCSWHVDYTWRENLNRIVDQEKQEEAYNLLRTLLLIERDINTCNITIYEAFNGMLADPDTAEFATYFKDNFSENIENWAYCHRVNFGLNANTHLEKLHNIFECIYLDRRNLKRIDKCLFVLMRFIKDQLFDKLVKHRYCTKITSVLQNLKERHAASLNLNFVNVTKHNNVWQVSSKVGDVSYVKIGDAQCKCSLKCKDCDMCFHKYSCSCLDNSINWNMCKHIHLVCRFLQDKTGSLEEIGGDSSSFEDIPFDYDGFGDSEEIINTTLEVSKKESDIGSFAEEKEVLCSQLRDLVRGISSPAELNIIKKCISSAKRKLKVVCSKNKLKQSRFNK